MKKGYSIGGGVGNDEALSKTIYKMSKCSTVENIFSPKIFKLWQNTHSIKFTTVSFLSVQFSDVKTPFHINGM